MIDVRWAARDDADGRWVAVLDDVERARLFAYRRQADRDRFLVAAALVRTVAAGRFAVAPRDVVVDRTCTECGGPHGRPIIGNGELTVSVSHAGDCVVVASADDTHLGVDVELIPEEKVSAEIAVSALGLDEVAHDATEFTTYWTRKEAVLKCTGEGLRTDLSSVLVSAPDDAAALRHYPARPELPSLLSLVTLHGQPRGYLAALAVIGDGSPTVIEVRGSGMLRDTAAVLFGS